MQNLPEKINTVEELNEVLSRPQPQLIEFMKKTDGGLMILGAGGKIGPTMVRTAGRAIEEAGVEKKIIAVDLNPSDQLKSEGVETIACDLLDIEAVEKLPQVKNIIYMAGRKFGSTGSEHLTWAINTIVPMHVGKTFTDSRIVVFSTGCVYPLMHADSSGATEETAAEPIGEYAMSCLGRERMFDYFAEEHGEKVLQFRLNYAVELRYGVLVDVATKVSRSEPVDVTTGYANVLWQGDACNQALLSLDLAQSPAKILNVTGPQIISIRQVAEKFAELLGKKVKFTGKENGMGYLSNAALAKTLFGNPTVPTDKIIEWIAHWIKIGGQSNEKPTHFETQDGKY